MGSDRNLNEEIRDNPYEFICNWMEEILPHTGKKAFEIISLMPPSLILPDLPYKSKKIRSNINVLLLTSSGGGKSTLAKELEYLSYSTLSLRSITPAKLESKIMLNPIFTLIIEDFATMSRDAIVGKILEGIIGDEKRVQRSTMKKDIDTETEGIGLICGVPNDLAEYLSGGLIFRLVPCVIFHNEEEHSNIGKEIIESVGENGGFDEYEEVIKEYYWDLYKIQSGENPDLSPIMGYHIDENFKKKAYEVWDKYTREIYKRVDAPLNWFRSLQEFFRFLVSHAFLNVFNRKVEDGILYPNEEDYKVAIRLMKRDLKTKFKLISMEIFVRNINNLKELSKVMESDNLSDEQKRIISNLIKIKRGKIVR